MGFAKKTILAVILLLGLASGAVFLLAPRDEAAIEKLLESGVRAAERGDSEALVALLSRSYRTPNQDYDQAVQRIRRELSPGRPWGQLELTGANIQVEQGVATVRFHVRSRAGPHILGEIGFDLKLQKEEGAWKVTSAQEIR